MVLRILNFVGLSHQNLEGRLGLLSGEVHKEAEDVKQTGVCEGESNNGEAAGGNERGKHQSYCFPLTT